MYYSEMTAFELLWLKDAYPDGMCEYRSPQLDGGTGEGRMIQCRNKAAMWTDRGLRCKDHKQD